MTSHKERRGARNKIGNKCRSTDGTISCYRPSCVSDMCVPMCVTECVPVLVPASMSTMVFVFPPKPRWRPLHHVGGMKLKPGTFLP